MIDSLEAYLALNAPAAPPVEAMGVSSPGMTSARVGGSPAGADRDQAEPARTRIKARIAQRLRSQTRPTILHRFRRLHGTEIEPGARIISAHSSRLQHALKDLHKKWDITRESWADQVAQDLKKTTSTRSSTWSSTRSWEWTSFPNRWGRFVASARRMTDAADQPSNLKPRLRQHA